MTKSEICEKKIGCHGNASEKGGTGNPSKAANCALGGVSLAAAGGTIDSAHGMKVGASRHEERSRSSGNNAAIFAHACGFLHILWDDVLVCHSEDSTAARRDPLVTALFGASARARD